MILLPHLKGIGTVPGVYKTQGYGEHPEIYKKFNLAFHDGDDYAAPEGYSDLASHDGLVVEAAYNQDGYGYYVKYQFDEDGYTWTVLHGHHKSNSVKVGEFIKAGQEIGKVGSTGFSTGNHVHRTVKQYKHGILLNANNGVNGAIDPALFEGKSMDFYQVKDEKTVVVLFQSKYYEIASKPEDYAYIKGKFKIPDALNQVGRLVVDANYGGKAVVGVTFVSN